MLYRRRCIAQTIHIVLALGVEQLHWHIDTAEELSLLVLLMAVALDILYPILYFKIRFYFLSRMPSTHNHGCCDHCVFRPDGEQLQASRRWHHLLTSRGRWARLLWYIENTSGKLLKSEYDLLERTISREGVNLKKVQVTEQCRYNYFGIGLFLTAT